MIHKFCLLQLSSLQSSLVYSPRINMKFILWHHLFKHKGQSELYIKDFAIYFVLFINQKFILSQIQFLASFDPMFKHKGQSELYIQDFAIYFVVFINIQFSFSYIQFLALYLILFLNMEVNLSYIYVGFDTFTFIQYIGFFVWLELISAIFYLFFRFKFTS